MTKLASWNVCRGLDDTSRSASILDGLERIDADVVAILEAARKPEEVDFSTIKTSLGYDTFLVAYDDSVPHPSGEQYMAILSRLPNTRCEIARLGIRNALRTPITIEGEQIMVTGAHFDDRTTWYRNIMARAFVEGASKTDPNILMGDLNSMDPDSVRARVLASTVFRFCAENIPSEKLRSEATRLSYMAERDGPLAILEENGYYEADENRQPTMLFKGIPIVQLDHTYHDMQTAIENYKAETKIKGSDHFAISYDVKIA